MNGSFVLSDDSHGIGQVGYGFKQAVAFMDHIGLNTLMVLQRGLTTRDPRFPGVSGRPVSVKDLGKNQRSSRLSAPQRTAGPESQTPGSSSIDEFPCDRCDEAKTSCPRSASVSDPFGRPHIGQ